MTQENYARCLANTLREEGGWTNDPRDPGGPTMFGIIQREYTKYRANKELPNQSVRYIGETELQEIYAGNYWKPMRGELWPKGPDQIVFDIAVNSGVGRAPQIMAAALDTSAVDVKALATLADLATDKVRIVKRACARRESFYRRIGTFGVFGRGWLARNARMEAIGVKMCLEAQNADVRGGLQREATGAKIKAKRSGRGAAASGTVGGGAAAGAGASDAASWGWDVWLTLSLSVVTSVALTLVLVWLWRKHGERAKAYAAAIAGVLETDLPEMLAKIRAAGHQA